MQVIRIISIGVFLFIAGCNFRSEGGSNVEINVDESGVITTTISLSETDALGVVQGTLAGQDNLFTTVSAVDMRGDGTIRIFGTREFSGGGSVDGSIDLTIYAQDGGLFVQIIAVDAQGFGLDSDSLAAVNDALAQGFAQAAADSRGQTNFTNVTITDAALQMTVTIRAEGQ